MAETVGSLVDKISITQLRIWHLNEAISNPTLSEERRQVCLNNLDVVMRQCTDLSDELSALWAAICAGATAPKVYRQVKLYNDRTLREASSGRRRGPPFAKTG